MIADSNIHKKEARLAKRRGMPADRILTLHPEGKQGVNIERRRYDGMRRALLKSIPRAAQGVSFRDVYELVLEHLDPDVFDARVSVGWYVVTVKLDLEARGEIARVEGKGPQRLRRLIPLRKRS